MKKICITFLFIACLFAIMFELTGADPDNAFTFRSYFKYVTENIVPFPTVNFDGNIFFDLSQIFTYVFRLVFCLIKNIGVLLYGLFPIDWVNSIFGEMTEENQQKWWNNLLIGGLF